MKINEYQSLAMRTNDERCTYRVEDAIASFIRTRVVAGYEDAIKFVGYDPGALINGALGITGEAGEVADMIKKHVFHGHGLDTDALVKEIGDVCWYVALLCTAIGVDMASVMEKNIEKLKTRYPEGFSEEASINRVV